MVNQIMAESKYEDADANSSKHGNNNGVLEGMCDLEH